MMKQIVLKRDRLVGLVVLVILVILAVVTASCNVTRTVTTRSEFWQKADTSVVIQTKTIESYDGTKK